MKLATLKDSTRDGKLVVVSRDLTRCSEVGHIARSLQAALDDWAHVAPRLRRVAQGLETGSQPTMRFHEHDAASPLPRAYLWSGGTGSFAGPRDAIHVLQGSTGLAASARAAIITDDALMACSGDAASSAVLLVLLAHDVTVDGDSVASCFSPVAVTPDELGSDWSGATATLSLLISHNGKPTGPKISAQCDTAAAVTDAAARRALAAGSILGASAPAITLPLAAGDTIRIEALDKTGHSIFGAIEQVVHG